MSHKVSRRRVKAITAVCSHHAVNHLLVAPMTPSVMCCEGTWYAMHIDPWPQPVVGSAGGAWTPLETFIR